MVTFIRTISNVKSDLAGEREIYLRKKGEKSFTIKWILLGNSDSKSKL